MKKFGNEANSEYMFFNDDCGVKGFFQLKNPVINFFGWEILFGILFAHDSVTSRIRRFKNYVFIN